MSDSEVPQVKISNPNPVLASKSRDKSPIPIPSVYNDKVLRDLVKKRGIVKGRFTRFINYVHSLINEDLSNQDRIDLKLRIQGASNLFDEFNSIQTQLEESVPEALVDEELTKREQFEDNYYTIMSQAECILNKNSSPADCSPKCAHKSRTIKLPTIAMPTFDGSYEQWSQFRDSFLALVHNSNELSNIEKYHYLKSSLKGSAEVVINSLEFSSDNYLVAWELLLNRYNNSRLLVHSHVKSLFTMSSITKESSTSIKNLIDTLLKNLRALQVLGEPIDSWDTLVIYMVVSRLDETTEREWEQHKGTLFSASGEPNKRIKVSDLVKFLKDRADMLETLQVSHNKGTDSKKHNSHNNKVHCNVSSNKPQERNRTFTPRLCLLCNDKHPLYSCQKFIDFNLESKLKFINDKKLCMNCLRAGHNLENCRFGPCRMCNRKHNSLVHSDNHSNSQEIVTLHTSRANEVSTAAATAPAGAVPPPVASDLRGPTSSLSSHTSTIQANKAHINNQCAQSAVLKPVLLSTALIEIADSCNNYHVVRAILDSGSERCFITKKLCDQLQAPVLQSTQEIRGVGNSITQSTQICDVEIKSRTCNFLTHLQCFVLPNITSALPAMPIKFTHFNIPKHYQLADPQFFESQNIDILIGADKFWDLMNNKKIKLQNGPFLLDTKLGWIVSGPVCSTSHDRFIQCNFNQSIDAQLRQFWELEEVSVCRDTRTDEERACEEHFVNNTTRNSDGRFCVRIPFKKSPDTLGETYSLAERRFLALEKRLLRNNDYRTLYRDFIHEYISLGHMSRVDSYGTPHYILPHHGVFREHSTTTKLRVVFDASAASSNNISLNELQMVGSPIQGDLFSILLRFRQYKYTACADIEKMYRQCQTHEDQRDLQLILWRDEPSEPISVYRLNTVTYGTASAPFLSCRCLKQLATDCTDRDVTRIINEDFFVDDLITSNDCKNKLLEDCRNVSKVLSSGCFPLRKWIFNFKLDETENNVPEISKQLSLGENVNAKILGLGWYNLSDEFNFSTQFKNNNDKITKRYIMSNIAQIFDPLGLLSPAIMSAKILLQGLWLLKIDWDDEVPSDVIQTWNRFCSSLDILNNVRVPRHVIGSDPERVELHIFSDASESAYGSCIYVRTVNRDSSITARLYCSKGKVAPLKPISIPKLELCGALLSARLYNKVRDSINCQVDSVIFWCDSTIVLGWLRMSPNQLKTFVQNRTAEIHEIAKDLPWCHVSGKENPADLVSRGISLDDLQSTTLWWQGPCFLHDPKFCSSQAISERVHALRTADLPEIKSKVVHSLLTASEVSLFPFDRFSQFNRMKRTCAYILRFIYNTRNPHNVRRGPLAVDELREANLTLIRLSQQESFPDEYKLLKNNSYLKSKHNLNKLNLFMDSNKIVRVGGRIKYSPSFSFDKKHPCLITSKHRFSILLFRYEHIQLQHAGAQSLLYNVRESHWPLGGRDLARRTVHTCVICTRLRGKTLSPIMGNLPKERITPTFPFLRCGVDYAGPIFTLNRKGRGSRLVKGYICLFVCLVTRAVHLELVSDLSSDAYLLALKRLISRRGKPAEIMSDNGRNFVGVANEFSKFLSTCSPAIIDYAISRDIKFTFIPPYAPHFGGLWEAGVKSCKHHLLRVVGNAHLTFEEFSTVLSQVEAILNSRPISPMSTDPNDFNPLSPAHFLVGRLLTAPASTELLDVPVHQLTRYERLEQMRQHFWNRWSKEYISEMQVRNKWKENTTDLQPNTLVVIKEDHTPPLKWNLGRIISTRPGKDGVARVADIQTATGVIRRAFPRICPLFIEE